ncbi:MAG: serine aminopeptidase domain-containing protein, partial [Anaerolineales bacterium]
HPNNFPGVVISAPTVVIPKGTTQTTIISAKVLSKIAPKLGMMQVDPFGVSSDPQVVKDYINDPLVYHGKSPVRFMAESLKAILRINDKYESITQPLLIVSGSEDALADPKGSKLLFEEVGSSDKTLKIYEGFHHEVFNEPMHETVLSDVESWIADRLS